MSAHDFGTAWWSPFVIVVDGGHVLSDRDLLAALGLVSSRSTARKGVHPATGEVVIAEGRSWKLISSDWAYTMWHCPGVRPGLWKLASDYRILSYSVGDIDDSYTLHLFEKGELVRELIVDDRLDGRGQVIVHEEGSALPGERGEIFPSGQILAGCESVATAFCPDLVNPTRTKTWTVQNPLFDRVRVPTSPDEARRIRDEQRKSQQTTGPVVRTWRQFR